jgi:integrase
MLTDAACRNAKCEEDRARARFADARGLYLEVAATGSKRWFVKYRFAGKERRLALGSFPEVSLKAARDARDAARRTRAEGTDPVQARQVETATRLAATITTFEGVAREFFATKADGWSDTHKHRWLRSMEKDLFPHMGTLPMGNITAPLLLHHLRAVEKRGAIETAHTLRQCAGQVFRYGIQTGRCTDNPAIALHGALKPVHTAHMAAILDPVMAGRLLRSIDDYQGQPTTRAALALSALLFQRPGNIRAMEWAEVDAANAVWTIPAAKMKRAVHGKVNGRPHVVPLARQALVILDEVRPLTGHGRYVFPSLLSGDKPMSENTVRTALRRMGYTNDEMTAHGFRAMARTLIAEQMPGVSTDVIEAQLAHGKSGPLGAAYDRAEFMAQRRKLMAAWADYLDKLRVGADVIELGTKRA